MYLKMVNSRYSCFAAMKNFCLTEAEWGSKNIPQALTEENRDRKHLQKTNYVQVYSNREK